MCFFTRGALLGVVIAFANSAAFADEMENILRITASDPALNIAATTMEGSANGFWIDQTSTAGAASANRIGLDVLGNANGAGQLGSSAPLIAGLEWGSLTQRGEGNRIGATVAGEGNLLAALQVGEGNSLFGRVVGDANQAAIHQSGVSNAASFSQTGHGNVVSISQTSW